MARKGCSDLFTTVRLDSGAEATKPPLFSASNPPLDHAYKPTHWNFHATTPVKVQELLGVYASGGAAALESYTPAQLQWERVQQLVKPGAVGLPIGYQPDSARQQAVQGRDGAGQPGLIAGA